MSKTSHALADRMRRNHERAQGPEPSKGGAELSNIGLDCGWGTLHFAHTYASPDDLAEAMRREGPGRRDIAFYVREPHVMLSAAPLELFLDPSHAYRLDLSTYRPSRKKPSGFTVRRLTSQEDAEAVNTIYRSRGMVPVRPDFFWKKRDSRAFSYLVAEDDITGEIIGTVTGIGRMVVLGGFREVQGRQDDQQYDRCDRKQPDQAESQESQDICGFRTHTLLLTTDIVAKDAAIGNGFVGYEL